MTVAFYNFYLIRWKLGKVTSETLQSLVPSVLTQQEADDIINGV